MSIKRIFSAGGIIVRTDKDGPKVLVTQHSKHKGWDFPKGHLEVGETSEQAALREVKEETGVEAEIIEKVGQTQYFYYEPSSTKASDDKKVMEGKERVLKTVTFFLMKYLEDGVATTAFEVSAHKWLEIDEVEAQLTFKDTKELWQKAKGKIESLTLND